jgi:eukaryotic-like serine/threonine-protein kinase
MGVQMSERASWELAEGDEIAQGRSVLRLLGGGRRYEAYLVWDERMLAPMVAKLLRPDQAEDEHALRALRREADALEALAHPVILRGFDADLDPPHPHVLVEHVEGPTLRELLSGGRTLAAERVRTLGMSVASALHYMAGEGWLHLDLKPSNILMSAPPRVIDLSLARTLERAARVREPIGTNAYMAPEQCEPTGELSPATDVWGLGATLYQALAGWRPFPKPMPEERFPQLHEKVRPLPPPVPRTLAEPVLACLQTDAAERPSAAELFALLRDAPIPPGSR